METDHCNDSGAARMNVNKFADNEKGFDMNIDELISNLISSAQDVTSAFEWGTGRIGAERELEEARQALVRHNQEQEAKIAIAKEALDYYATPGRIKHQTYSSEIANRALEKLEQP